MQPKHALRLLNPTTDNSDMISNEQAMAIREIAKTLGTLKTLEQICDRMKCRVSDLFDEEN